MELVIVEREYEGAADVDAMSRIGDSVRWCYEQRSVTLVCSLVSPDLRRFVCMYRAPDAESVRAVQRTAGFDFVRAWTSQVIGDVTGIDECVIVERVLGAPITAADAAALVESAPHLVSHLSRDGLRLTSMYSADPPAIALPVVVASERRWAAKRLVYR